METSSQILAPKRGFWHFLIPATRADLNLCKTILSATLLNYSAPTLVNWNRKYDNPSLSNGGSHLAKIPGILDYLTSLSSEYDDDLVLIVDGYDMWFQLKPDVLLSRYYAINERAQQRISQRLCGDATCSEHEAISHISQQIVFGAQKKCWPHEPEELACYAAPPSMLPDDVFGPETDQTWPSRDYQELKMRTRYINSGFVMGPAGALRRLFKEANRRMELDSHHGSDQGVFSDVLGAQEYARELARSEYRRQQSSFRRLPARLFERKTAFDIDRDQILAPSSSREVLSPMPDPQNLTALRDLEYGIGLDYFGELSHTTVFAHRDADWVVFDQPKLPSQHWNILSPVMVKAMLPDDLARSSPPFILANGNASGALARLSDWSRIPLYTNLYTGTIPATIHHNAWQNGMKSLRDKLWGQMWWEPYVRELFWASDGPRAPIAVETSDQGRKEWWSPVNKKASVRFDDGTLTSFKELCSEYLGIAERSDGGS